MCISRIESTWSKSWLNCVAWFCATFDLIVSKIDSVKKLTWCKTIDSIVCHIPLDRLIIYWFYLIWVDPSTIESILQQSSRSFSNRVDPSAIELILQQSSRSFSNRVNPSAIESSWSFATHMLLNDTHWTCAVLQSAKQAGLQTPLLHLSPQTVTSDSKSRQKKTKRNRHVLSKTIQNEMRVRLGTYFRFLSHQPSALFNNQLLHTWHSKSFNPQSSPASSSPISFTACVHNLMYNIQYLSICHNLTYLSMTDMYVYSTIHTCKCILQ